MGSALLPFDVGDFFDHQCSCTDLVVDDGTLHFFVAHRWRYLVHFRMQESALEALPTARDLASL